MARKRSSSSAVSVKRAYTPSQLSKFRGMIDEAVHWAAANRLDVMPNCWSLSTIYGVRSCAQMGFCCPLGAVVLRAMPKPMKSQKWSCFSAASILGASEDFVTGFIAGYEGHTLQFGLNAHHAQGYRMGCEYSKIVPGHVAKRRLPAA